MMTRRCVWICALSIILSCEATSHAGSEPPTLLVIPARYTVVQFAFDVARLRSAYLLSYRVEGDSYRTFLWDKRGGDWIDSDSIDGGSLFSVAPGKTIIIGPVDENLIALSDLTGGATVSSRIPSLDVKDIVNGLHGELKFRGTEWRWLAARYGFELKDRNAERRRWGRYGPPGAGRMPPSDRLKAEPIETQSVRTPPVERKAPAIVEAPAPRRSLVITLPKEIEKTGVAPEAPPPVEAPAVPEVSAPEPVVADSIQDESAIENADPFDPPVAEDMAADSILDESAIENAEPFDPPAAEDMAAEDK